MKIRKPMLLTVGSLMFVSSGMPVSAKSNSSMTDMIALNSNMVETTIDTVSNLIHNTVGDIEIETPEPVEEFTYTYVEQPVYYTGTERVNEPVTISPDEFIALYGQTEAIEVTAETHEKQAAYDTALINYNAALAEYEAASQLVETTKEVEVEVVEETFDEKGNPVTETRTEIRTVTETSFAGDVESAKANLDAARNALDIASADLTSSQDTVLVVETEESLNEPVQNATEQKSGECGTNLTWSLDDAGVLTISGTGDMNDFNNEGPWGKDIKKVVVTEGASSIGEYAFYQCTNLTEIVLPTTLINIKKYAFSDCENLPSITIPNGVTTLGDYSFSGCQYLTNVTIPSSVTTIKNGAFSRCIYLETIVIPDSVTTLESLVFAGDSSLSSVTLSKNIIRIESNTFRDCQDLKEITIPEGVTSIDGGAFRGCTSLTKINIPTTVEGIGENAFMESGLTEITLPNSLTFIGAEAFKKCGGLTEIVIPNSVKEVQKRAFEFCQNLKKVTLSKNVTDYDLETFSNCTALESVIMPEGVQVIGYGMFQNCTALKNLVLPTSIEQISQLAFWNCTSLETLFIDESVSSIDPSAFKGCTNLTLVVYPYSYALQFAKDNNIPYRVLTDVAVKDSKHTLSLNGNIGVNFYLSFADFVKKDTGAKIEFTIGTNKTLQLLKDAVIENNYYKFSVDVTAAQMTTDIQADIILSDDNTVYSEKYTVKQYCDNKLSDTTIDDKLRGLLEALLNYGAYSQIQFNVNTDHLANADLTNTDVSDVTVDMLAQYASSKSGSIEGIKLAGSTLTLNSLTSIRHYFTVENGHSINEYTFKLGGMPIKPVKSGNMYYVEIGNIVSKDLDVMYNVYVGDFTVRYGALSYAHSQLSKTSAKEPLKNVCRALYKYNQAANAYFGV